MAANLQMISLVHQSGKSPGTGSESPSGPLSLNTPRLQSQQSQVWKESNKHKRKNVFNSKFWSVPLETASFLLHFFSSDLHILAFFLLKKITKWIAPNDITIASNGINSSQPLSLPYLMAVFATCIILKTLGLWESQEKFINQDTFWKQTRTGP